MSSRGSASRAALWWGLGISMIAASASAQGNRRVVPLPFGGEASEGLREEAEDAARAALTARGWELPDRGTVRASMPVAAPSEGPSIVAFGRSMGGVYVLTGEVRSLTGQFTLRLRLYEVASSRVAEQYRSVGEGESAGTVASMVAALFAPGALSLPPEEQARLDAERRRLAEERAREAAARRAAEAARRADEERRRREAEERNRRIYRFAEGGRLSLGAYGLIGGRVTAPSYPPGVLEQMQRDPNYRPPSALAGAIRVDGGYALAPSAGLELGAAALVFLAPTPALALGPAARISLPTRSSFPLRASAGAAVGLFQGFAGARATGLWLAGDLRAEWDVTPSVGIVAGAEVDWGTGSFAAVSGLAGLRVHLGDRAP